MKKFIFIVLVALAALFYARSAPAQEAQVPFNIVNPANPNVMIFLDNTGYMGRVVQGDPEGRQRWELTVDVLAGKRIPITYTKNPTYDAAPVFQPHYDFTTVGQFWALDSNTIGGSVEDAVIPRIIRLIKNPDDTFSPSPVGSYFIFIHLSDATRVATILANADLASAVTNLAEFFRLSEPATAAINTADRWDEYYIIRDTESGIIDYSTTDVTGADQKIWHADDVASGVYLSYYDALLKYYYYEETGTETGGSADTNVVVALKYIAADKNIVWTSESDGLAKKGLCYFVAPPSGGKPVATACYKPCAANDPAASNFFLLLTGTETAEEVVKYKTTLTAWRTARGSTATRYCYNSTFYVWGDMPYINWQFNSSDNPTSDGNAPVPIYGATISGAACLATSPGAFTIGVAAPTNGQIETSINALLLRVFGVDASVGDSTDEFVLPPTPGSNPRIDTYLKANLNDYHSWWCDYFETYKPSYICPALLTWPTSISFETPWYGGYYDHLYWNGAYKGSPGIMESYQNVNYGFASYDPNNYGNDPACDGADFPADSDGNCRPADLIFNVPSYGEFAAYKALYPPAVLNENLRQWLMAGKSHDSSMSPIASSLHNLWNYFYNTEQDKDGHSDDVESTDDIVKDARTGTLAEVDSMFFDLGFPNASGNYDYHIIQCDPFYKNGCRRNYLIYITGGRDRNGERLYDLEDEPWDEEILPDKDIDLYLGDVLVCNDCNMRDEPVSYQAELAAMGKWIVALKDPGFINAYQGYSGYLADFEARNPSSKCRAASDNDKIPWGVKSFWIGFGDAAMNNNDKMALSYLAYASVMDRDDPDEIGHTLVAENEETLRAQLTIIMNAIMAGQFARAAPEISQLEGAIITTFFEVGGSYPLWKGHLLKWDLPAIQAGSTVGAEWDFADLLEDQAKTGTRNLFTVLDGATFSFWGASSTADLIDAFDPSGLYWGNSADLENAESAALIDFINGDPDATFTTGKSIRSWLGPTYHSKPLIVGPPNTLTYLSFPGYAGFMLTHAARPSLVYVGTGHGILHAISLDDQGSLTSGQEVYGWIPPGVLQYLPMLRRGQQPYGVDGSPVVRDALFYDGDSVEWRTTLMVGLAGGGTSYSALDITTVTESGDDAEMLWNFSDNNLALTYSVPTIGPINYVDSAGDLYTKWAAFFGGGLQEKQDLLQPDRGGYFYILDLQAGAVFQKFEVPDVDQINTLTPLDYDTTGDNFNQVPSTPILVDKDLDRDYDYAFFGDMQGRVWKVNFSATLVDGVTSPWQICPFYDTADLDVSGEVETGELIAKSERLPVYYTPDAARTPDNKLLLFFGTGNAEWLEPGDTTGNAYVYALIDPETTGCDYAQQLPETIAGDSVFWPLALEPGELMLTPVHIIAGKAIFKTFLPEVTIACSPGTTRLWTLNYLTGDAYIPGQPYVTTTPEGDAIGTTDISFDIGIGGGSNAEGKPETFEIPILPADPLSWGEGVAFD